MATFQYLEQRDSSDNITREGVVSKSTAYATSDNQGAYDTIAADLNYLGDKTSQLENTVNNVVDAATQSLTKTLSDNMHAQYPVGSYIYTDKSAAPNTWLPYMSDTKWEQAPGRVLIGAGTATDANGTSVCIFKRIS